MVQKILDTHKAGDGKLAYPCDGVRSDGVKLGQPQNYSKLRKCHEEYKTLVNIRQVRDKPVKRLTRLSGQVTTQSIKIKGYKQ